MHFRVQKQERPAFLIDMAPLIDIVFLLLIFFMITSRLLRPAIDLDLPEANAKALGDQAASVLSIDKKGGIFLDSKAVLLEDLSEAMRLLLKEKERSDVILQADSKTPFSLFVHVIEKLRAGGASKLNIESRPPQKQ